MIIHYKYYNFIFIKYCGSDSLYNLQKLARMSHKKLDSQHSVPRILIIKY